MKKIIFILILLILIIGCARPSKEFPGELHPEEPPSASPCALAPGEWHPIQGECPGTTSKMKAKCEDFCAKHPNCCIREHDSNNFGGRNIFALPEAKNIAKLTRIYPSTIKAINEGPAIYGQGQYKIISDETLDLMKETGFNTIQLLTINDCTGEKCIMDETSKAVLLNDIVKAKQKGLTVWVATELVNAPPGSNVKLPEYPKFKQNYLNFLREFGALMEEYQVEYVTVNNEPDLFLQEQTQWGSEEQINQYVVEIMPLNNLAVKEKFKGKTINKITQPKKRTAEVLAASLKEVDIAGIDVGPPMTTQLSYENYAKEFDDYQYYASLAEKSGVLWMNAEYWQYNYFEIPTEYIKQNQLKYAQAPFSAYLKVEPKGVGYTWNDFSTFTLPQGEETRLTIKEFFKQI